VSPVPRSEVYGGQEPAYELSEDEAELFDILDTAYRSKTGRSLEIDGFLQGAARRMNWLLRRQGFGFSGKKLWEQIVNGDSITDGLSVPASVPLASEAQRSIWLSGGTLAYPFVFTGLSAGLFDNFDADRLSWEDIEGFGCNVVGVGVHKQIFPPGRWVTFIFAERGALLDEFPKIVDPGETYQISGEVLPGYYNPGVLVTTPYGEVNQYNMVTDYRGNFRAEVAFNGGPGEYLVEMTFDSPNGPKVGGLFPVSAGGRHPESYSIWQNSGYQVYAEPDQAEQAGVSLINRDRQRFRQPTVTENPVLSRLARQYSEEMRNGKFLSHVTPEGKDLRERLEEMGIPYVRALENVSVGYSIDGIEAGLMNSPGHRRNILDPDVNQVGVGVAWTKDEDPPRAYLTQLFVRTFTRIDPMRDPSKVFSEINQRRIKSGMPPLVENSMADLLARDHSRRLAEGSLAERDSMSESDILVKFQKSGIPFARAAAVVKQVFNLDQIMESDILFDSTYTWAGLGLSQSEQTGSMASWIWVTVILYRD
jgi:uncharacterized protein YkwD